MITPFTSTFTSSLHFSHQLLPPLSKIILDFYPLTFLQLTFQKGKMIPINFSKHALIKGQPKMEMSTPKKGRREYILGVQSS